MYTIYNMYTAGGDRGTPLELEVGIEELAKCQVQAMFGEQ